MSRSTTYRPLFSGRGVHFGFLRVGVRGVFVTIGARLRRRGIRRRRRHRVRSLVRVNLTTCTRARAQACLLIRTSGRGRGGRGRCGTARRTCLQDDAARRSLVCNINARTCSQNTLMNIARQRRTRRARSARRTRPPTNQDDPGVATVKNTSRMFNGAKAFNQPLWARKTTRRLRRRASAGALPRPRSRDRAPASGSRDSRTHAPRMADARAAAPRGFC